MNERDVFANGALTLPRKISILKTAVRPSREPLTVHADLPPHPALARWLEEKRITRSQDGELAIALRPLKPADMQGWTLTPAAVEEGYIVELRFSDSRQQAIIGANSDRALGYALETLGALALDKWRVEARIEDYPAFAVRGIIEGFYGTPWPQRNRLDMLEFIARRKMNTYFYAPKDDPYHRRKWAKPYDPESLDRKSVV